MCGDSLQLLHSSLVVQALPDFYFIIGITDARIKMTPGVLYQTHTVKRKESTITPAAHARRGLTSPIRTMESC